MFLVATIPATYLGKRIGWQDIYLAGEISAFHTEPGERLLVKTLPGGWAGSDLNFAPVPRTMELNWVESGARITDYDGNVLFPPGGV